MFVQIFTGTTGDGAALRRQWEDWLARLAPGADGWLGSTGGLAGNGEAIFVARFATEADARRNSERPEQGEWWAGTEKAFATPPAFTETADVVVLADGGSDAAGFVQVMRARCSDRARWEAVEEGAAGLWAEARPDFMGALRVWSGDVVHCVDYFTSEAEARAGERQEPPEELKRLFGEWMSLLGEQVWYDLPEPWLASPS